jgi:hypothetical protein
MAPFRIRRRDVVVACDLTPVQATDRLGAWQDLRARFATGSGPIDGGARLWLRPEGAADAEALAREEATCCAFLDIEVAIVNGRLRVDLTCPVPEGESVARALVGLRDDPAGQ